MRRQDPQKRIRCKKLPLGKALSFRRFPVDDNDDQDGDGSVVVVGGGRQAASRPIKIARA